MGKKDDKNKKPRIDYVYGVGSKEVTELSITFDPSGAIHIADIDPSTIRRQITYAKENSKDKVVYSVPADHFGQDLDQVAYLKTKFDFMLAVDTNTLKDQHGLIRFDGHAVSACTIAVVTKPVQSWDGEFQITPLASYLILDLDPAVEVKHEPLGWYLALTRHTNTPFLNTKRLGMVVDSELGKHVDINARRVPYYAQHMLPVNTTLIYASSDKPEMFANDMLKYCDNVAGQTLDQFKLHGIENILKEQLLQIGTAKCLAISHAPKKAK